jgi:hypothetical protein
VLGAISAVLIILLAKLLFVRVPANKPNQIVEMGMIARENEFEDAAGNQTSDEESEKIYENERNFPVPKKRPKLITKMEMIARESKVKDAVGNQTSDEESETIYENERYSYGSEEACDFKSMHRIYDDSL